MSIQPTDPRPVVVLDLDNCCADDSWRIPHIDWSKTGDARYRIYHALSHLDDNGFEPIEKALRRMCIEPELARFVFLTSRPLEFRTITLRWLSDHMPWKFNTSDLIMRNPGDHRHSEEVKADQLRALFQHNGVERVDVAFDDRQQVLDAYRATGLPVKALMRWAIHDVCAYSDPHAAAAKTAPEILREGAAIYEQRNAVYGDNYKHFGTVMLGAFPHGVTLSTKEDWDRLHLIINVLGKMTRYAQSFAKGGHRDSAIDAAVYSAMLTEMTNQQGGV